MQSESKDLSERLLGFAASSIKPAVKLDRSMAGKHIANQLMRAASSAGANYEEACGAESRADFIHKMQLVLKESRESLYWLKLAERSELILSNPHGRVTTNESWKLTTTCRSW